MERRIIIEFASELAEGMELYRAGRRDPSLKSFLDDLRSRLRGIQRNGPTGSG